MSRRQSQTTTRKTRATQKSQLSQITLEASFSRSQSVIENLDELVNSCVRYIVYRAGNGLPIRKIEIQKFVLKNVGRKFDEILDKVKGVLKDVYAYDLHLCDDNSSSKKYLVSNSLPYKSSASTLNETVESRSDSTSNEALNVPQDVHKILIMLVLTHIFMSNNNATEASLFGFLQLLNIDVDENHDVFGNVKTFISTTLVNQKYLNAEAEGITRRITYSWGSRAEHEISKLELLKFVCKIYMDRNPKSWMNQFVSATNQFGGAEVVENGIESMDVTNSD